MATVANGKGSRPQSMSELKKVKFLGHGAFGHVWRCTWPGHDEIGSLAVKEVDMSRMPRGKMRTQLEREFQLMRTLRHPYIVKHCFDFFEGSVLYIGMAFAENGNLFGHLTQLVRMKRLDRVAQWFWEICDALEYLHGQKIVHRDIKPENILLDKANHALLADFGWSNVVKEVTASFAMENQGPPLTTFCGTAEYMAPEMVAQSGHDEGLDMWMMGILLYEMIAGYTPYAARSGSPKEVMYRIKKGDLELPAGMNADAIDLTLKLLRPVSADRLRANEAKEHLFIKKNFGGHVSGKSVTVVSGAAEHTQLDGRPSELRRLDEVREKMQGEMLYILQEKSQVEQELFQVHQNLEDVNEEIRKYNDRIGATDKEILKICQENTDVEGSIQDAQQRLSKLREEIAMRQQA
eukprot:TRINITY_DN13102_c0_g2_i1.p1 TRINITY_DN13102_c0_g2~~TRINITY_DN13102_c0_g2_i1.p1  ORF type:complete len:407 (+),score=75.79 TRINITY_DN13102_c0_g2_i1:130-1350(+)